MTAFSDPPRLPEWLAPAMPFSRRMFTLADRKAMHVVEAGEGTPVLLVHGNPTWSFLWRKVMPPLVEAGCRVVAPDLIGLGLSDKPPELEAHSLAAHIGWVGELVDALEMDKFVTVGQDWGGPIAAGVAAARPERVAGAVFANTAVLKPKTPIRTTPFHRFSHAPVISDLVFRGLNFPVPVMDRAQGDRRSLDRLAKRAYRWPLRRWRDRAAPLAMARMVPDSADHPSVATLAGIDPWVRGFAGPKALVWGRRDPILGRAVYRLRQAWPDAPLTETEAGHFLQEEVPAELAAAIADVARRAAADA